MVDFWFFWYQLYNECINQRKFRSLTSDNMDSWKSSAARKKINRCGKKEDQQARNVREVAKCCVFQCFVCRLGRKVTSLKRRVRRWLLREDMKNGTPLWREAPFQKKCASRYMLGPLFEVAMLKNCTPLWREAHFQKKCASRYMLGPLFEVAMWKNCTPLWREAHFQVKIVKNWRSRTTFWSARRCSEKHIFKSKS